MPMEVPLPFFYPFVFVDSEETLKAEDFTIPMRPLA